MVPQRLASITSLEIIVTGRASPNARQAERVDWPHLGGILDDIATHCHGRLRTLSLGLKCRGHSHADDFLKNRALPSLDAFFLSMPGLRDMRVEVPQITYKGCRDLAETPAPEHPLENTGKGEFWYLTGSLLWRCLDPDERGEVKPATQIRSFGNFPDPPRQLPTSENRDKSVASRGYWIAEGQDDGWYRFRA